MRGLFPHMIMQGLLALTFFWTAQGTQANAQNSSDPIQSFVGDWDLPGDFTSLSILSNHYVQHSKWGRGDIRWDNADYFSISYRQRSMTCHYIIRLYSPTELSVVRAEQMDPPECDLGELRRSPGSIAAQQRSENAVPAHSVAAMDSVDAAPVVKSQDPKEALPSVAANAPAKSSSSVKSVKSSDTIQDCSDCPELTVIPKGSFSMGSPIVEAGRSQEEGPVHTVALEHFVLGRFPVTTKQFAAFLTETGYSLPKSCLIHAGGRFVNSGYSFFNPGFQQDETHPAVCVSWYDALAYVSWLSQKTGKNYRLPSESEREYATRAGTSTPYSFGNSISTDLANYDPDIMAVSTSPPRPKGTLPVASFLPNAFGLYQMHGNIAEWTQDCWNNSYNGAPSDGSAFTAGDCSRRVLRGGAWGGNNAALRSAYREATGAGERYFSVGFRVAREVDR
jgi:formylglycine-generating enzyme required for sulfatase activity